MSGKRIRLTQRENGLCLHVRLDSDDYEIGSLGALRTIWSSVADLPASGFN